MKGIRGIPMGGINLQKVIMMDASLNSWGATCNGCPAYGVWKSRHLSWHINCLEMLAVCLAPNQFLPVLLHHHVIVRSDNMMVVSYINRQGGL